MCGIGTGKVFPNCLVGKNMSWLNYNDFTTPSSLMCVLRRTIPRSQEFSVKHDIYPGWCQIQVERNWKEFSQKKWTPSWSFELYDNYLYKLAQCIVYSYLTSWIKHLGALTSKNFWILDHSRQKTVTSQGGRWNLSRMYQLCPQSYPIGLGLNRVIHHLVNNKMGYPSKIGLSLFTTIFVGWIMITLFLNG